MLESVEHGVNELNGLLVLLCGGSRANHFLHLLQVSLAFQPGVHVLIIEELAECPIDAFEFEQLALDGDFCLLLYLSLEEALGALQSTLRVGQLLLAHLGAFVHFSYDVAEFALTQEIFADLILELHETCLAGLVAEGHIKLLDDFLHFVVVCSLLANNMFEFFDARNHIVSQLLHVLELDEVAQSPLDLEQVLLADVVRVVFAQDFEACLQTFIDRVLLVLVDLDDGSVPVDRQLEFLRVLGHLRRHL